MRRFCPQNSGILIGKISAGTIFNKVLDSSHEPLHVAASCELSNTLLNIVPAEIFWKQKSLTIEKQKIKQCGTEKFKRGGLLVLQASPD